jgi:hypothetical protein
MRSGCQAAWLDREAVRSSDRSGVGCSHTTGCPLFPLLNTSLRGWRNYYCDSEDRWLDCARYKLALKGEPVPISLLPNGKQAHHLDWLGWTDIGQAPPPAQPPARRPEPAPHSSWGPPPERPPHREPARRWWTRLADWMRGPA